MQSNLEPGRLNDKLVADKWNHLSGVILAQGRVKLDWYKIRQIPVIRCHRCLKVIRSCSWEEFQRVKRSGELCRKCHKLEEEAARYL